MSLAQPSNLPSMTDIHQVNQPNPHILELKRDNLKMVGEIKEQVGALAHLEERNKLTSKALRGEAKWIETAATIQGEQADLPAILENSRQRNNLVMLEMDQQSKVILHLKQYHEGAAGQLEQHSTQMLSEIDKQAKMIFHLESQNRKLESRNNKLEAQNNDLESQNGDQKRAMFVLGIEKATAEYERAEQLRIADSMERRLSKMKEVLNNQAQTMLSELEYQQELIDDLDNIDEEFFQPSHNTMVDMTENIENWTSEDNDDEELTFEFETESHESHEIISGLERHIDLQDMKLEYHEAKVRELKKIIYDLRYQNNRLTSELDFETDRATSLLEMQNIQKEKEAREKREKEQQISEKPKRQTKKWQIEQICNAACKKEKEAMISEISNINHRLIPLEGELLNGRQLQFCNYLKKVGSVTAAEANTMICSINQKHRPFPPTEADARMVLNRLPHCAADFKHVYGVSPEKVISSSM
jgi:hypothetical protein